MTKIIHSDIATVDTFSIDVKVVRVGKRQMTLSVFKQLPLKPLLDKKTHKLNGMPWGQVNYWWKGSDVPPSKYWENDSFWERPYVVNKGYSPPRKLHVVWQHETVLYRSVIWEIPNIQVFESHLEDWRKATSHLFAESTIDSWGWHSPGYLCMKNKEKCEHDVAVYNEVFDQLSQLDQLFIAV